MREKRHKIRLNFGDNAIKQLHGDNEAFLFAGAVRIMVA